MIEKIKELEKTARLLEPDRNERAAIRGKVLDYTEDFLDSIYDVKAYEIQNPNPEALLNYPIGEEPADADEVIAFIREHVDGTGLNPASGGHLGYIPGGGIYYSALGDYIADVTNRYAGVYFAGQGAVQMENMLIRWMAGIIGYPEDAGGNHASGGSVANLIAIVTARDACDLKAKDFNKSVVYLSEHAHHSIDKALRISGMGECHTRHIPLDKKYKIIPSELKQAIQKDRNSGLNPWMVIAAAGTTDVGAVDPLQDIGEIAKQHDLWYHIDGAYGAFFILVEQCKELLKGMEMSDSIVMDPHKGLFLPYGLGTVLVKDKQKLHRAHYYDANYMQDAKTSSEGILSPAELSPELTKHFRGMRLWLPLKLMGLKPFRACLEEKLWLTKYFHQKVKELGFETGPEPELSVSTFRYIPEHGDANIFNEKLIKEIHKDGRVFMSSTLLDGKFTLRMAALAFRTHLDTIDLALEILQEKVEKLLSE